MTRSLHRPQQLPAWLLFVALSITNDLYSQSPTWASRYNGPVSKQDGGRTMAEQGDFVYVTGPSEGRKGDIDYITIKYSKTTGQQLWATRYNGPAASTDQPYSIAVDINGYVYVTGGSTGSGSNYDYATVKYRPDGSQEWVQRFGTARNDIARDVKVDAAGNVYVTGFVDGANAINGNAIVTIKYSSAGVRTIIDTYNGLPDLYDGSAINREEGTSLAVDAMGNVYVGGISRKMFAIKYSVDGNGAYSFGWLSPGFGDIDYGSGRKILICPDNNVVITGFEAETIKFNGADGSAIWKNVYLPGSVLDPSFWDMTQDASGNVYVTGNIRNSSSNDDYLTVKYNSAGGQEWAQTFNGSANLADMARSISYASSPFAEFVCVTGVVGTRVSSRVTVANMGTVKYNATDGTLLAALLYDGPEKQGSSAFETISDNTGAIFVTGETTSKQAGNDVSTIKYAPGLSTTASNSELEEEVVNTPVRLNSYPNPARETSTISFSIPQDGYVRLSVIDQLGREVKVLHNSKTSAGVHLIAFETKGLSQGAYIYRLKYNNTIHVKRLVVAR